jgi:UDP-2,3-diacylglucosamine pyrophosphatase LpxH
MITSVREERLLITSDTHVGSYFCNAGRPLARFLEYACTNHYNVCFNGDGIDILHTSLGKITHETSGFLSEFRRIVAHNNITIYYTVGNHDIVLEHYLADWGQVHLVPFLNVTSGRKRYRIEHGHLYDPFYSNHPGLMDAAGRLGYYVCRIHPAWYHWYKRYLVMKYQLKYKLGRKDEEGPSSLIKSGEGLSFFEAAEELARRGFDAVILGHTHCPGVFPLKGVQASYFNTGSWFDQPYYVEIDHGEIELKPWPV